MTKSPDLGCNPYPGQTFSNEWPPVRYRIMDQNTNSVPLPRKSLFTGGEGLSKDSREDHFPAPHKPEYLYDEGMSIVSFNGKEFLDFLKWMFENEIRAIVAAVLIIIIAMGAIVGAVLYFNRPTPTSTPVAPQSKIEFNAPVTIQGNATFSQ